jgi:uncharacterized protein YgiM (DUF1202 family)
MKTSRIKFALLAFFTVAALSGCGALAGYSAAPADKLVPLNPKDWPTQARPTTVPTPTPFPRMTLAPTAVPVDPAAPAPTPAHQETPAAGATPAESGADPKPAVLTGHVTQAAVNLRSGPGTSYAVLGSLSPGLSFTVQAANPARDWLFVETGGKHGWVAASLVTVSGDVASLPQATPAPVTVTTPGG